MDFVGQRLLLGLPDEAIDGDEEGGEGLAGACGGGDQCVTAGSDFGPAECLGVCGGVELALEPGADGGVEGGEDVVGHHLSVFSSCSLCVPRSLLRRRSDMKSQIG